MEPVLMDRQIDLHEKMLSTMQHSFKKVRKRIHKVELSMHLKPPDTEVQEVNVWKNKVDNMIATEKVEMNFPTMSEIRAEYLKTHHPPIVLSTGEHIIFNKLQKQRIKARTSRAIPLKSIKKLNAVRDDKTFGATKNFGALDEGQELKVIKNYAGCNTMFETDTRKLVRKDGRMTIRNLSSSCPEWLPPGVYENTDPDVVRRPIVSDCGSSFSTLSRSDIDGLAADRVEDRRVKKIVTRASWDEGGVTDADELGRSQQSVPNVNKLKSYQMPTKSLKSHTALSSSRYATDIKAVVNASRQRGVLVEQTDSTASHKGQDVGSMHQRPQPSMASNTSAAAIIANTVREKENEAPTTQLPSSTDHTLIRGFETVDLESFDKKMMDSQMNALNVRGLGRASPLSADVNCRKIVMGNFVPEVDSIDEQPTHHHANHSAKYRVKDWTMGAFPAHYDDHGASSTASDILYHTEQDLLQSSVTSILSPHPITNQDSDGIAHANKDGVVSMVEYAMQPPPEPEKDKPRVVRASTGGVRAQTSHNAHKPSAAVLTADRTVKEDMAILALGSTHTDIDGNNHTLSKAKATTSKGRLVAEHLAQYKNYAPQKKVFTRSLSSAVPLSREKLFQKAVEAAKDSNSKNGKHKASGSPSGKTTRRPADEVLNAPRPATSPVRTKPNASHTLEISSPVRDPTLPLSESEYLTSVPLDTDLTGTLREWKSNEGVYTPMHRHSSIAALARKEKHKAAFSSGRTAGSTLVRSSSMAVALQGTHGILLPGPGTDVDGLAADTTPRISTLPVAAQTVMSAQVKEISNLNSLMSSSGNVLFGRRSAQFLVDPKKAIAEEVDPEMAAVQVDEAYWEAQMKAKLAAKRVGKSRIDRPSADKEV